MSRMRTTEKFTRTARCRACNHEFKQEGTSCCFGGYALPEACPECGSKDYEVPMMDLPIYPSDLENEEKGS